MLGDVEVQDASHQLRPSTAARIVPSELAPRFLIFERDAKCGVEVPVAVKLSPIQLGPISITVFANRLHMISD